MKLFLTFLIIGAGTIVVTFAQPQGKPLTRVALLEWAQGPEALELGQCLQKTEARKLAVDWRATKRLITGPGADEAANVAFVKQRLDTVQTLACQRERISEREQQEGPEKIRTPKPGSPGEFIEERNPKFDKERDRP